MKTKLLGLVVLLAIAVFGYLELSNETQHQVEPPPAPAGPAPTIPDAAPAEPRQQAPATSGIRHGVQDAAIKNYGKVIYRGPVDLTKTIERIRAGISHPHRNDGSVFGNREGLLPRKERGYYREYVHPTDGIDGPGPQRLVVGRDGDWWYTPDHYASFIELGKEAR